MGNGEGKMSRKWLAIILAINTAIGAWLGVTAIVQFTIFLNGKYIYEPNSIIAITELILACLFTLWFIIVFPILLKRGFKDGTN